MVPRMPRSFMIAHRRSGQDALSSSPDSPAEQLGRSDSSNSIDDSPSRHEKMIRDSCPRDQTRTYPSPASVSPVSRKQAILQRQSLDKYASVSDGESDSGCSTLTDSRHELAPELEYSWDCPSELSLLVELMTHSPRKHPCRDVGDAASGSKCAGQKLIRRDFDSESSHVTRSEDCQVVYVRRGEERMLLLSPAEAPRFVATGEKKYECFEHSVAGSWPKEHADISGRITTPHNAIHVPRDAQIYPRSTPEFHNAGLYDHESKPYYAQRRISFDGDRGGDRKPSPPQHRPESPNEEPIDYSQLSTRRKDTGRGFEDQTVVPQDLSRRPLEQSLDEPRDKIQRMAVDADHDVKRSVASLKSVPKFEFILSPQIDGNGNVVLSQRGTNEARPELKEFSPPAVHANFPGYEYKNSVGNFKQQSSPMSGSPASPLPAARDPQQMFVPDVPSVKFESSRYSGEASQVPYHPKLKYLLAASQYAKAKVLQEEDEDRKHVPALASSSPYTAYQKSVLFSQEQTAQDKLAAPTNDPKHEGVHFKSESSHFESFPTSEKFQSSSAYTAHNLHSTNVFIVNTGSSINTGDVAKGSNLNESHHQIIEIHPIHIGSAPSIQISSPIIDGCGDALILHEQYHDGSVSSSPPPSDQQLSPTSARDQQSALSELLFSSNRKSGVDPYACADCGKRYSTSSNLARHRQTHRSVCDKKARKCPHCDKVYVSMPAFSMHVRTHNQGCECPHCGKKFSRPWLLQGHIRTHTGEKPFGCPQCGKSFADKSNLRAHIQTHSTDKPYVCGRCGKAFALKSYLYKHEESSCMRGQRFRE